MAQNKKATPKKWTADDVKQLWNGTMAEVAKKLGRTVASVSVARTAYKNFKPGGLEPTEDNIARGGSQSKDVKVKRMTGTKAKAQNKRGPYRKRNAAGEAPITGTTTIVNSPTTSTNFKMVYNGTPIELQNQPKKITMIDGGVEIEF